MLVPIRILQSNPDSERLQYYPESMLLCYSISIHMFWESDKFCKEKEGEFFFLCDVAFLRIELAETVVSSSQDEGLLDIPFPLGG